MYLTKKGHFTSLSCVIHNGMYLILTWKCVLMSKSSCLILKSTIYKTIIRDNSYLTWFWNYSIISSAHTTQTRLSLSLYHWQMKDLRQHSALSATIIHGLILSKLDCHLMLVSVNNIIDSCQGQNHRLKTLTQPWRSITYIESPN